MKETMYSGIDSLDNQPSLMWVCGDVMAISTDYGPDDPWRDASISRDKMAVKMALDLSRFTDLTVVWERN